MSPDAGSLPVAAVGATLCEGSQPASPDTHEEPHMPPATPRLPGIDARSTADGTRYRVRINRRGVRCNVAFADLGEAVSWRTRALRAIDNGDALPPMPDDAAARPAPRAQSPTRELTILDAAKRFLAGVGTGAIRTKTGTLYKPSAVRKYEAALRLDVIPRLGRVKASALTSGEVQRVVDHLAAERGVEQAINALTALRVVAHMLERYGELAADPCASVRVPRIESEPRKMVVPSAEACRLLIDAAQADDRGNHLRAPCSFIAPLVRLALDTGLRDGELLGLRWGEDGIDLDASLVHVTQAIDRKRDPDTHEYRVIPPKSRASRRSVPMSADVVKALRAHRLATGRPADGALVWSQSDGRPLGAQGKVRSAWRRVRKAADLAEMRFHDLRHTYATHQLASGTTIHAVAKLLGHADAALVLRRYGHAMPDEIASSAERLAAWRAAQR